MLAKDASISSFTTSTSPERISFFSSIALSWFFEARLSSFIRPFQALSGQPEFVQMIELSSQEYDKIGKREQNPETWQVNRFQWYQ